MADGLRPCILGIKPFAALAIPATVVPERGLAPGGTGSTCPGGEDHLKRRSSSPPVPPLLGCRHCPRRQTEFFGCASAALVPSRGCKGRSPLHKKTKKSPPFPPGRGAGGMGEKSKLKAGQGGNPNRQAPLQVPQRQGLQVPQAVQRRGAGGKPPRPPPGTGLAASARNRKENTPAGNNRRGCS